MNDYQDDVITSRDGNNCRGVSLGRKVRSSVVDTSGSSQRVPSMAEKEALREPH